MVEIIDDKTTLIQTKKFPIYIMAENRENSERAFLGELKKMIIKKIKQNQLENIK